MGLANNQTVADEWVTFPGGELEGKRPKVLCAACRRELQRAAAAAEVFKPRALCFQCYRAELDRERALKAAGELDTASVERFQTTLPFEPVNMVRLSMLKAERATERESMHQGVGRFVDKRRHAQIAARHALQAIFAGVRARQSSASPNANAEHGAEGVILSAIHAAELQLPESWLPFVMSR
jgi:hypothetical protein